MFITFSVIFSLSLLAFIYPAKADISNEPSVKTYYNNQYEESYKVVNSKNEKLDLNLGTGIFVFNEKKALERNLRLRYKYIYTLTSEIGNKIKLEIGQMYLGKPKSSEWCSIEDEYVAVHLVHDFHMYCGTLNTGCTTINLIISHGYY